MNHPHHDTEYLHRCRELIEQKLHWPPATEWRNYEFTELSEKILDATGTHLSATTLKRVFGKLKYDSLPSSATLNALASYLGFPGWMDFKSGQRIPFTAPEQPASVRIKRPLFRRKAWIAGTAAIVVCAILAFTFLAGRSSPGVTDAENILFTSKPLAEGLPNSVVFRIDLKKNKANTITIQQSWDSTRTVKMKPGQTEATGIYYFPGYFRAKLILDGQIVKEHDLFIRSDKWMATIDHHPIPTYLKKDELVLDNGMKVNESVLSAIKNTTTPVFTSYHLVKPFGGLQSDNFSLETSIQNTHGEGAAVCKTVKLFVLCSKGAFIIPFTIPGCVSDINLKLNDLYLDGKSNDLSAFSADLSTASPIKLEVRNRRVKIFLHNKLVREATYTTDAGEVVGLRFSFLGAGAVDYIKLADGNGTVVYEDGFRKN